MQDSEEAGTRGTLLPRSPSFSKQERSGRMAGERRPPASAPGAFTPSPAHLLTLQSRVI